MERMSDYLALMQENPSALRGQQLRGGGPVAEFERKLASLCGFPHCLATCNATMSLLVVALAANLKGKEVVACPNSWGGTFGPFEFAGSSVIHAASDEHGNILPASVANRITGAAAAVVVADWKGVPHDSMAIRSICDQYGLLYIYDSGRLPGWNVPSAEKILADVCVLSFGPGKPLALGEGGALLVREKALYEASLTLSQHPERCRDESVLFENRRPFLNGRIHPLAALLGLSLLVKRQESEHAEDGSGASMSVGS